MCLNTIQPHSSSPAHILFIHRLDKNSKRWPILVHQDCKTNYHLSSSSLIKYYSAYYIKRKMITKWEDSAPPKCPYSALRCELSQSLPLGLPWTNSLPSALSPWLCKPWHLYLPSQCISLCNSVFAQLVWTRLPNTASPGNRKQDGLLHHHPPTARTVLGTDSMYSRVIWGVNEFKVCWHFFRCHIRLSNAMVWIFLVSSKTHTEMWLPWWWCWEEGPSRSD